jgi:hypothetical protein
VLQELLVRLEQRVLLEHGETTVAILVFLVQRVQLVLQAQLDQLEKPVLKVLQDRLVL